MEDTNLKKESRKELLYELIGKVMTEANVPYKVHMAVVDELHRVINAHRTDMQKWQAVIDSHIVAKGDKGDSPSPEELTGLIGPLIPAPVHGKDYVLTEADKRDIAGQVDVPVVEKVIERTKVIKEQPVVTEKLIEKDIDQEKLVEDLLRIIKKKRLLDSTYIKGLEGFSRDGINYRFEELMHGGGGTGGGSITYAVDLSAQCNGVNKVFTVPANTNFISLAGSDAPNIYRPTVDYTGSGTLTLTLTAQVNAPSSGATLVLTYIV